jgi:glycosyltransferase involved in cell wall biosynthesis
VSGDYLMAGNVMASSGSPLVSIGIPCFENAEGLERLLTSMTAQTIKDIEIIVSDNCSPNPNVERVARRYAAHDSRVKVFRQPTNLGIIGNHQFVKDQACGKYFMWAHDDDEFPTNYIEACLNHFRDAPDVVLVGTNCDRYFEGQYFYTYSNYSNVGLGTYERLRLLMSDAFVNPWHFEQYWNGLFLLNAGSRIVCKEVVISISWEVFRHFFVLAERGTIAHAAEATLIKHTTQHNLDNYYATPMWRWRITLAIQLLRIIWTSKRLRPSEKAQLAGQCVYQFAAALPEAAYQSAIRRFRKALQSRKKRKRRVQQARAAWRDASL